MNESRNLHGIIWLASYPKSGNTWTRNFLHNLINVMAGEELGIQDINKMNHLSTWEISGKSYEKLLDKNLNQCTREEIASVRHQVQQQIADDADGLAFVKTHHALVMDRKKPTINFDVTCGAIYIVRNPLDVAISFSHHLNASIDEAIEQMAIEGLETPINEKSVYEVYSSWSQHVESWTRKPQRTIYVMRYEDMLSEPETTFRGLAHHLLLEPSIIQLERSIELSSFEKLQSQETEKGFREKPKDAKLFFRSGRANQWREELNGQQIDRIVKAHRKQMERFNYYPL
ncbi:MAG: sulfotransferase domain-containing protein [Hyphomicrobiales bacterium]|nr:sulfotransferase domain-containing protein [Hyphomicrobiales bacterium]